MVSGEDCVVGKDDTEYKKPRQEHREVGSPRGGTALAEI